MKRKLLKRFLIFIGMTLSTMMISLPSFSQTGNVTGKVSGRDDGLSLPGVTVRIKGTSGGAVTNVDGVYSINAAQGSVLIFSFLGYEQ
ncbi:MAG: carboxypeptidase-like regulatory domain-containing protein, partial [Mucilaginibacter sp.]